MLMHEPPTHLSEGPVASLGSVLRQRDIRPLWVLTFVFGVYYSALVTFLPNHTQLTLGVANLSAFMIPFSLVAIALRLVLGKQLDRRPPRRFLYLSFAAVFAAQVFLFLPASLLTLGLAGFCYGLGHSILYPLLNSLVVNKGGEAHKAVYSNAFVVVNLVSPIIITPLLGALGDVAGFNAILLVLAMAALAGVLLSRRNFPRPSAEPI
jgi:MFS family permease